MEQEKKLAEYRARKKREEQVQKYKESFKYFFTRRKDNPVETPENEVLLNENTANISTEEHLESSDTSPDEAEIIYPASKMRIEFYILFTVLWIATYILFIKLQFGTIYLIISAIFGIYLNTRTGPKDKNEISAYSVFNKNCESIDGTLKAEQFEREIRYGPLNVH